jgi:hypothetical protein
MITVQIDETELVADWQTARQAIQALQTLDDKHGGVIADALEGIKRKIRETLKSKAEAELMQDFRSQLGL